MKKFLSLIIALVFVMSTFAVFPVFAAGTEYNVSTAAELNAAISKINDSLLIDFINIKQAKITPTIIATTRSKTTVITAVTKRTITSATGAVFIVLITLLKPQVLYATIKSTAATVGIGIYAVNGIKSVRAINKIIEWIIAVIGVLPPSLIAVIVLTCAQDAGIPPKSTEKILPVP